MPQIHYKRTRASARAYAGMFGLSQLLYENQTGLLASGATGRGYTDNRTQPARRLSGVYRFIKHQVPSMSKKKFFATASRTGERASSARSSGSTKALGKSFHQHIHHRLVCKILLPSVQLTPGGGGCECPPGQVPQRGPPRGGDVDTMLTSAENALRALGLVPLCGEKVIVADNANVGTRFDMLCARRASAIGGFVLVSWKTTGACPFALGVTKTRLARSIATRPALTSDENTARQHIAQVACELYMLIEVHNVTEVDSAVIIYLYPGDEKRHRAVWIESDCISDADYKRVWKALRYASTTPRKKLPPKNGRAVATTIKKRAARR